jgi:hypothetical protein
MSFYFLTNCPKAGTHLMRQVLGMRADEGTTMALRVAAAPDGGAGLFQKCMLFPTGLSGEIGPPSAEMLRFAQLLPSFTIIRDPRDIIVSWYHYIDVIDRGRRLSVVECDRSLNYKDYEGDARKDLFIETVYKTIERFLPWGDTDIITVRFEDIIERPIPALEPVAKKTGIPVGVLAGRSMFRGGKTFRKGLVGEWKHEFNDGQKKRFDELYGHIMEAWGYD